MSQPKIVLSTNRSHNITTFLPPDHLYIDNHLTMIGQPRPNFINLIKRNNNNTSFVTSNHYQFVLFRSRLDSQIVYSQNCLFIGQSALGYLWIEVYVRDLGESQEGGCLVQRMTLRIMSMLNGKRMFYLAWILLEPQWKKLSFLDQHVVSRRVVGWGNNLANWLGLQRRVEIPHLHFVQIWLLQLSFSDLYPHIRFQGYLEGRPTVITHCLIKVRNRTFYLHNKFHSFSKHQLP